VKTPNLAILSMVQEGINKKERVKNIKRQNGMKKEIK